MLSASGSVLFKGPISVELDIVNIFVTFLCFIKSIWFNCVWLSSRTTAEDITYYSKCTAVCCCFILISTINGLSIWWYKAACISWIGKTSMSIYPWMTGYFQLANVNHFLSINAWWLASCVAVVLHLMYSSVSLLQFWILATFCPLFVTHLYLSCIIMNCSVPHLTYAFYHIFF